MSIKLRRPRYADVTATLALVIALGGTAVAVGAVLPKKSVGPMQLKKLAVINPKIADGAVQERNIKPESISFKDLKGTHTTFNADFSLNAGQCKRFVFTLTDKGGANGQPAFVSLAGTTSNPMPLGLTVSPIQLLDGSAADVVFCNVSASTITLNNVPGAIVSFGDLSRK